MAEWIVIERDGSQLFVKEGDRRIDLRFKYKRDATPEEAEELSRYEKRAQRKSAQRKGDWQQIKELFLRGD